MKIEGTSGNDSSVGQMPDPRVDFSAWARFKEDQVGRDYERRWLVDPTDHGLLDYFVDQTRRCHDEITEMQAQLGIPVAPLGPEDEEVMRRTLAMNTALLTLLPLLNGVSLDDAKSMLVERANQILAGNVPDDVVEAVVRVEETARKDIAALVERHSRGELSHVDLAAKIRGSRFALRARRGAPLTRLFATRLTRRSKPRRREHGRRARSGSRGSPPRSAGDPPLADRLRPLSARGAAA